MTRNLIDRVKLNSAEHENGKPVWIKLVPKGQFTGRDKRGPYTNNDADKVIAATMQDRMESGWPIDYNHATFKPGDGGHAPAAGWIKDLQNRDGEIWGSVEWTPDGEKALGDKNYRYISPAFMYNSEGEVKKLLNAALTNNPNLYYTAICSREDDMPEKAEKGKQQKIALHSAVDEAHKIIKKASADSGVPHHAFLSAMADKATEEADTDAGGDGVKNGTAAGGDSQATESRDDTSKGGGNGDGTTLQSKMKSLQEKESKLCGDDEADGDADEDEEAEFSQHCEAAAHQAETEGNAEMAASFMMMARASRQRIDMKKASPDELETMAAQARTDGRHIEAIALHQAARARRTMSTDTKTGLTEEQVAKIVRATMKDEMALHTKGLTESIDLLRGDQKRESAVSFVDKAIREKRLTPAERDDYISLHMKDSATCETLVSKRIAVDLSDGNFARPVPVGGADGGVAMMARNELAICSALGLKPEKYLERKKSPLATLDVGLRSDQVSPRGDRYKLNKRIFSGEKRIWQV